MTKCPVGNDTFLITPLNENTSRASSLPRSLIFFLAGSLISSTGTFTQIVGEGWLVAELSQDPFWLGFVGFCGGLPFFMFSIFGGAVADRYSRRTVLIVCNVSLILIATILSLLNYFHVIQIWHVAVLAFCTGTFSSLNYPAYQGFLFDLVGGSHIARAVSLNATSLHISRMVGPALAGLLIERVGVWGCFAINAFSFLPVLPIVMGLKRKFETRPARSSLSIWGELKQGILYARSQPQILISLVLVALTTVLIFPHISLLPLYVKKFLGAGPRVLGNLWVCSGAGALMMTLLYPSLIRYFGSRKILFLQLGALGCAAGLMGLSRFPDLVAGYICVFVVGLSLTTVVVGSQAIIQERVGDQFRGRMMGLWTTCFQGMFPLGNILIGSVAQVVTIPIAWFLASSVLFVALFGIFFSENRRRAAAA